MELGRSLLAACLAALAVLKLLSEGPPSSAGTAFSWLNFPLAWYGLAIAELIAALAILLIRREWITRAIAACMGVGVVVHLVDVMQRGSSASGCGCFGDAGLASTGLDLIRASLVFALFATGSGLVRTPHRTRLPLVLTFAALVALVLANPAILADLRARRGTAHGAEARLTKDLDAPSPGRSSTPVLISQPMPWPSRAPIAEAGPAQRSDPASGAQPYMLTILGDGEAVVGVRARIRDAGEPALLGESEPEGLDPAQLVYVSDEQGRIALPPGGPEADRIVVLEPPPPWRRLALTLHDGPEQGRTVELTRGTGLQIRVIDLGGDPIANVEVLLAPVKAVETRRGEIALSESGDPVIEELFRLNADGLGYAQVGGLLTGRSYRGYVPGFATPPGSALPEHAVAGVDTELILQVAPLRIVWGRAIDSDTGQAVHTARWLELRANPERPASANLLRAARMIGSLRDLFDLQRSVDPGDIWLETIAVGPSGAGYQMGPFRLRALGYEEESVTLEARELADARTGPQIVKLTRSPGATLGDVEISCESSRRDLVALVQIVTSKRIVFSELWDSASPHVIATSLPPGEYELIVGGGSVAELRVAEGERSKHAIMLDELPSVRLALSTAGTPYDGVARVMLKSGGDGGPFWLWTRSDEPISGGLSDRFVVSERQVDVIVRLRPDASPTVRTLKLTRGEHVEVAVDTD